MACEDVATLRNDTFRYGGTWTDILHHSLVPFSTRTSLIGIDLRCANAVDDRSSNASWDTSSMYSIRTIRGETTVNRAWGEQRTVEGPELEAGKDKSPTTIKTTMSRRFKSIICLPIRMKGMLFFCRSCV